MSIFHKFEPIELFPVPQSADISKQYPDKEEINLAIRRYNVVVNVFGQLIDAIEEANANDNKWFIFSEKIGKKYLTQAYTLQHIFSNEVFIIKKGGKKLFVDFSSTFSLLRVQLENYAVFFHLFVDRCHIEEKILRFWLWQLDGLRERAKYIKPQDKERIEAFKNNPNNIENCISAINKCTYFKNLDAGIQDYLIKCSLWRFNDYSLKNTAKNKIRLAIDTMVMNTGIKETHFEDWYAFTSTHTHTNYWSVIQNDSFTDEEKMTTEYIAVMQAIYVTSFFIKDFCKIYEVARTFFNSLPINERDLINSFDVRGRNNSPPET